MSHGKITKRIGHLPDISPEPKRRTNKKLRQWILSYLGVEARRNPNTNSLGSVSLVQISQLAPSSILRSEDDILNTTHNMQEKGLIKEVAPRNWDFPQFQITPHGIIQFRKHMRPIASLAINQVKQYQIKLDAIEGDPQAKAELKKVPERIKESMERDSEIEGDLKKVPKRFRDRLKDRATDKAIDIILDTAWKVGLPLGAFIIAKLMGG